ncbi:MAG: nitrate reductase subunit alpha, partial [Bradymonadaceae bacterium]
ERKEEYKSARGKAGWRRADWDEALEMIGAAQIYTIQEYGADHLASFSPIPAMSLVSFLSGQRLNNLLGGTMLSFYEWYHDLPHIMPMIFGDQTDVHESADWYQSAYWMVIGSNLPMTRTPDAHFASEHKYNGGKLVNLAPDYSDVTKFSDLWVPAQEGTDGAFLQSCIHVILQECFHDEPVDYFTDYVKQYSNLPFLVRLEKDDEEGYLQGRFLRASDFGEYDDEENDEWKLLMADAETGELRLPPGSIGFRWEDDEPGRWNLEQRDVETGEEYDPLLTLLDGEDWEEVPVRFADFVDTYELQVGTTEGGGQPADDRIRNVPARRVETEDGDEVLVTTAFDLLMAQMGVDRDLGGDYPDGYDDEDSAFTPAWQESETGVSANLVTRVAREWAETARKTEGKCLFITGSGILHWFHGGTLTYRAMCVMGILTGCMGRNGGGFAHYVGTEKVRPYAAIGVLGGGGDWGNPARFQNSTSYFYFHTDQWRYDGMQLTSQWSPWAEEYPERGNHSAEQNVHAVRQGWLPFYPQFDKRSPQDVLEEARADGAETEEEVAEWVADQFDEGDLQFALEDVDAEPNHPKFMWIYRGNLIGTSMRGHEYGLKHFLGTHNNVLGDERAQDHVDSVEWHEEAPIGKMDMVVNANLRMDSSANYSDIVLPTAHWYEKYDLTCTDLHSFFHPFTPAHDPPWECRSDWDIFESIARKFTDLAEDHLAEPVEEIVLTPHETDTPEELAQPMGEGGRDWTKEGVEPVPGENFPHVEVVERDYTEIYDKFVSLGPEIAEEGGFGAKGIDTGLPEVYEELKHENHLVGTHQGRPSMVDAEEVAEIILKISPETNGEVSYKLFEELEDQTGLDLTHLIEGDRDVSRQYSDLISQPRRSLTSPHWSAIEEDGRTYSPWTMNIETLKPFRTLSGRMEVYFDHRAYRELGESLPTYKPPIDMASVGDCPPAKVTDDSKMFRFVTPHGKWQIHSMFWDSWHMQNMFRGGPVVWIGEDDARQLGIEDNDWVEVYNENGIIVARAVISQTMPDDLAIMYHMSERHVNVPFSDKAREEGASDLRGGNNNATTRIKMNPATMIGGYANFSYFLNYWGTSPSERDCAVMIRKMPDQDVIYREEDLPQMQ